MMDKRPTPLDLEKLMLEISKLNAVEFLGVANFFHVELVDEDKKPRNFETILSEVLDKYILLSRRQRRNFMKLIKSANLGKIDNG